MWIIKGCLAFSFVLSATGRLDRGLTLRIRSSFKTDFSACYVQPQLVSRQSSFTAATIFPKKKTICFGNHLLLCFCQPVIGPWALMANNTLELTNQIAHCLAYQNKPYSNNHHSIYLFRGTKWKKFQGRNRESAQQ